MSSTQSVTGRTAREMLSGSTPAVSPAVKGKAIGAVGSVSGASSILGSWQVCHAACLGIISLLSILGIVVTGMPLLFLTKLALPFWIAAAALFSMTLILYFTRKCIPAWLILFNSGLLIVGIPFPRFQAHALILWAVGGSISLIGLGIFMKDKLRKDRRRRVP